MSEVNSAADGNVGSQQERGSFEMSDRLGRKGLIVWGMWGTGGGAVSYGRVARVWLVATGQRAAGRRDCHGLPHFARRYFGRLTPDMACPFAQRVPLLARHGLRDRRVDRRCDRRHLWSGLGYRRGWDADVPFRCHRRMDHEKTATADNVAC
jgi:hypothetical protein